MSLSTAQITAQLDRLLASDARASAVAIRAATRQPWPETVSQRGRTFALRWCESSLAMREALCSTEEDAATTGLGLLLLTPLRTHEVAEDIAARLFRGQVFQPEGWDMVRQLFQAGDTDARLGRYPWMPQWLIDGTAQGPYPAVTSGFLDLDTAWREVLRRFLGLPSARPDTVSLLQWSAQPRAEVSLNLLPAAPRRDVLQWLADAAGSTGALVLACVEGGRTADALPLGLACGVVFAAQEEGLTALGAAAIRLERYVEGRTVARADGRAWAHAAEQALAGLGPELGRLLLERADALLVELQIGEHAHLSDALPQGLAQRMRRYAATLSDHVQAPDTTRMADVERQADEVLRHRLCATQPQRMDRVEMSRRIARWLCSPAPHAETLPDAVAWQADDGAFLDWARFRLLGGDDLPELSRAYAAVRDAVIVRRDAFARTFAQHLVEWNARGSHASRSHTSGALGGRTLPVERVLEQVLAPLAAAQPVLLLVMDGLSTSICRELLAQVARLGWTEVVRTDLGRALVGVAALPTITEVSRASLLCGRLTTGASSQEKSAFVSHQALLAHSRPEAPPRLFHKGDLAEETNLSLTVRAALAATGPRVVGVVYNAVDDHLSGPDQLHQRWSLDDLRLLLPLLHEAREARRVIVVTADHGHLLEDATRALTGGKSDRWRPGLDARAPDEVALSGGRVVVPDAPTGTVGAVGMVGLWGERTRYAGRKNGYHGGVSPQEVTVPLNVLVPQGLSLPGWQTASPAQPDWWELPPLPAAAPSSPVPEVPAPRTASRRAAAPQKDQIDLFGAASMALPIPTPVLASAPVLRPVAAPEDWIGALFGSPIYASQRQLAARVAPPDEQVRQLLGALDERGGKLSRTALAQRMALTEMRLMGLLSAMRRLLNVDQAAILGVDETAGTVVLNRVLLVQQFQIGAKATGGRP